MLPFNELAHFAGVAELADAQDLGSCGLKTVEVQILSPAPFAFFSPLQNFSFTLKLRRETVALHSWPHENAKGGPWSAALSHC